MNYMILFCNNDLNIDMSLFIRSGTNQRDRNEPDSKKKNLFFDNATGKFIVNFRMDGNQYGRFAQQQVIADIDSVEFDQQTGQFVVPVYMSPAEYTNYVEDKVLPARYNHVTSTMFTFVHVRHRGFPQREFPCRNMSMTDRSRSNFRLFINFHTCQYFRMLTVFFINVQTLLHHLPHKFGVGGGGILCLSRFPSNWKFTMNKIRRICLLKFVIFCQIITASPWLALCNANKLASNCF